MKQNDLISKAMMFAGFLIGKKPNIDSIILFGSVARGDFDAESDIDIFIETDEPEKQILAQLDLFNKSSINESYSLRSITNDIVLKIGKLEEWESLSNSVLTDGILLYGKYSHAPKEMEYKLLFKVNLEKLPRKKQVSIWRKLYGYTQQSGNKRYAYNGLLKRYGGEKISNGIFIISSRNKNVVEKFIKDNKIGYSIYEFWTREKQ